MDRSRSSIQGRITVAQYIGLFFVIIVSIALFIVPIPLFFAFVGDSRRGARLQAERDIRVIVNAVQNYYEDYGKYPLLETGSKMGDIACGDPAAGITLNNSALFNVLRDIDAPPNTGHVLNPRNQKYIETHVASNPSAPRDGFLEVKGGNPNAG